MGKEGWWRLWIPPGLHYSLSLEAPPAFPNSTYYFYLPNSYSSFRPQFKEHSVLPKCFMIPLSWMEFVSFFKPLGLPIFHCYNYALTVPEHIPIWVTYLTFLLNFTFPEAGDLLIKLMQQISNFWHPPHYSPDRIWYINIFWIELKENKLRTCIHVLGP